MGLQFTLTMYLVAKRDTRAREVFMDNDGPGLYTDPFAWIILLNVKAKLALNLKDKIFALYGVFQELKILLPTPDYKKDVVDVYREAVITAIKYDKGLNILYYVPSNHRMADLPS